MKLSLMREFVKLAANRNYSRTAEELYIAQPVLSRHMASLEKELRVKLIDRTTNSFQLTDAGTVVLEDFKKILENYKDLLDKLSRLDEKIEGELHLGVLYYDINCYVAKIREVFKQRHPNVKLILHSYQPQQLEMDLVTGKIDVAILYGVQGCIRHDIDYLPFLKIPYFLIYDKNHRLSLLKDIHISDLDGEKLLSPDTPFEIISVGDSMYQMLDEGGAHISETIPVNNYDEVPWVLKDTGGIYISPMANSAAYGDSTETRLLLPEIYGSDVSAVWLKENKNAAVRLLCSTIKICFP